MPRLARPCPFCGSEDTKVEIVVGGAGNRYVRCAACGAGGPNRATEDLAVRAWNKRSR